MEAEKRMNPYECLGVERTASAEEIKKVYRKLARETHPDLNPGDAAAETRFKEISVANDILGDETRRRDFDEFGDVSLRAGFDGEQARTQQERFGSRFGAPGGANSQGHDYQFNGLDDLLKQFRGRGDFEGGARFQTRGDDVESSMKLDFMEAIQGGERKLSIRRPTANGRLLEQTVTVRIPPGVTDGGKLRIPGKGAEGSGGGAAGDLWIRVRVSDHPVFRRQGRHLEFDLPLTLAEALGGAKIDVPTLDGRATLAIPAGTSSHARLRLRGKGIPGTGGRDPGHLFANIKIVLPKDLDAETLDALTSHEQEDPRKELFQ